MSFKRARVWDGAEEQDSGNDSAKRTRVARPLCTPVTSTSSPSPPSASFIRSALPSSASKPFVPPGRRSPAALAQSQLQSDAQSQSSQSKSNRTKTVGSDLKSRIASMLRSDCCALFTVDILMSQLERESEEWVKHDTVVDTLTQLVSESPTEFGKWHSRLVAGDSIVHVKPLTPTLTPAQLDELSKAEPVNDMLMTKVPTLADRLITPTKTPIKQRTSLLASTPKATPVTKPVSSTNHLGGGPSSELKARLLARRGTNLTVKRSSPSTITPIPLLTPSALDSVPSPRAPLPSSSGEAYGAGMLTLLSSHSPSPPRSQGAQLDGDKSSADTAQVDTETSTCIDEKHTQTLLTRQQRLIVTPNPSLSTASVSKTSRLTALQSELTSTIRAIGELQQQKLLEVSAREISDLNELAQKWLHVCQRALQDFLDAVNQRRTEPVSMAALMRSMNFDNELLRYDLDKEEFLE